MPPAIKNTGPSTQAGTQRKKKHQARPIMHIRINIHDSRKERNHDERNS
jgi:hypothetical protein